MIEITLNGAKHKATARTLAALLIETEMGPKVATAHNGQFVPAHAREATLLSQGDVVEVLSAMQGG